MICAKRCFLTQECEQSLEPLMEVASALVSDRFAGDSASCEIWWNLVFTAIPAFPFWLMNWWADELIVFVRLTRVIQPCQVLGASVFSSDPYVGPVDSRHKRFQHFISSRTDSVLRFLQQKGIVNAFSRGPFWYLASMHVMEQSWK